MGLSRQFFSYVICRRFLIKVTFRSFNSPSYIYIIAAIGNFYKPFRSVDPPRTINAILGQPLLIDCPKSSYFYPKIMYWAYFGRGGISLPLSINSRVNELQNGTLYFTSVEMEDISKIKRNGGIHCAVYSATQFMASVQFLLELVEGIYYFLINISDLRLFFP